MTDRFSLPSWSARNPLGIVALFISLIYAMSAALLGVSIKNLTEANQTILVIFVVVFPFVVLSVFAWLVANHHRKLYGPGDYRSDEGFLNAAIASPPLALGQRLREEVEHGEIPSMPAEPKKNKNQVRGENEPKFAQKLETQKEEETAEPVLRAYAAENLVFQELQNEFGGAVRRHVSINTSAARHYQLDGVLESKNKSIFVEVKNLFARSSVTMVILNYQKQFGDLIETFKPRPDVIFLLAIVTNFAISKDNLEKIASEARSRLGENFEFRIYSFAELSNKYGLLSKPQTRLGNIG